VVITPKRSWPVAATFPTATEAWPSHAWALMGHVHVIGSKVFGFEPMIDPHSLFSTRLFFDVPSYSIT
jgi:hypothetical protein